MHDVVGIKGLKLIKVIIIKLESYNLEYDFCQRKRERSCECTRLHQLDKAICTNKREREVAQPLDTFDLV